MKLNKKLASLIFLFFCAYLVFEDTGIAQQPSKWGDRKWTSSTPGVHLELQEIERVTRSDGIEEVGYELVATGFPKGKTYSLLFHPQLEKEPVKVTQFNYDHSDGSIEEAIRKALNFKPGKTLKLYALNFSEGEPYKIALISDDETVQGYALDYPYPIEDKHGSCHLYLERFDLNGTMYGAFGHGFAPNKEVLTEWWISGMLAESMPNTDSDGTISFPLSHPVQDCGISTYSIMGESVTGETCFVRVKYEWGLKEKVSKF